MSPKSSSQKPIQRAVLAASAAITTLLGAVYADQRYGIVQDLKQVRDEKAFQARLQGRLEALGQDVSLYHMLQLADRDAEVLWFEGRRWTYAEVLLETDRLAAILHCRGMAAGDTIAIFATNSPEMVFAIAAASKLGIIPALINSSLRAETLRHCLRIANCRLIVCTPDLAPAVVELEDITANIETLSLSLTSFPRLNLSEGQCQTSHITQIRYEDLAVAPSPSLPRPIRIARDTGALVYTSGTSGKPKAVAVKNFLLALVSTPMSLDANYPDKYMPLRTHSCLPLFHGTALFAGLYYSVGTSSTFCLMRNFSASKFSTQLVECQATRVLYVGELCRYLLAAPPSPNDNAHKCIVAYGNGLHRDVWEKFQQRFEIPEIREVYRSTEGVAKFDNFSSSKAGVGMVGHAGLVKSHTEDTTYLVKYDPSTESVYRDPKTGFCLLAEPGEPGEAIGRVRSMDFYNEYYKDPSATQLKLISDVFQKGDLFQRTGDLLVRDKRGWIRFHDRSGDTFRWRGENVSASEVRDHIAGLPEVEDVSVYAVKLAGYDGQAGAAAVALVEGTDEAAFAEPLFGRLQANGLAVFQFPRLLRFCKSLETTATFKQSKATLKTLPWNPTALTVGENIYWLDGKQYRRIDDAAWSAIESGKARL